MRMYLSSMGCAKNTAAVDIIDSESFSEYEE